MIAFVVVIANEQKYRRYAARGIRRVAGSPLVVEKRHQRSIAEAYNEALDSLATQDGLEAAVLLHEDTEILDSSFRDKLRAVFSEPDVAVAGPIGARGITSLAWWDGDGAGRVNESRGLIEFGRGACDVEAVDGLLMVFSAWAARELRFDTQLSAGFHGYDVDVCFEARRRGRRVQVADLDVFHHTKGGYGDRRAWRRANRAWQRKWRPKRRRRRQVSRLVRAAADRARTPAADLFAK